MIIAVVALSSVLVAYSTGYLPIRLFDSAAWQNARERNDGTRISMVEWLMRSGRLDGLERAEVLSLLGPPHRGPYFQEHDLVYYLGDERHLLSLDSEWLVIDFGDDGRVATYRTVAD